MCVCQSSKYISNIPLQHLFVTRRNEVAASDSSMPNEMTFLHCSYQLCRITHSKHTTIHSELYNSHRRRLWLLLKSIFRMYRTLGTVCSLAHIVNAFIFVHISDTICIQLHFKAGLSCSLMVLSANVTE